ncbi:hypothetical protein H6G51_00415 [Limnothrix sp. FACHB-708]|uniref:hypothetical protein n=1 Tax=unclassified Limnothrix TaxID=2632864 RepID=UPI001689EA1F|nr:MULTISPECIES: hypothetical protein [unclassified Limnothrix]MBD2551731.1 hypothetical protein [Limnothrix sp. FACHB-708]MBD2591304.1 hypothetical protein [Limnothrix sp. FACHB-406]
MSVHISDRVLQLGYEKPNRAQLREIGKIATALSHSIGLTPSYRNQLIDGQLRLVRDWQEHDLPLVDAAIHVFFRRIAKSAS